MKRLMQWLGFVVLITFTGCQSQPVHEVMLPPTPKAKPPIAEVMEEDAPSGASLRAVAWQEIPPEVFQDEALHTWVEALKQSATYYKRIPADQEFQFGSLKINAARMREVTRELAELAATGDTEALERTLKERYRLYRSVGGNSKGNILVTGYFEPLLHGSTTPSKRYFYPIYRRPPELVDAGSGHGYRVVKGKRVPYYTRAEIDDPFLRKPPPKAPDPKAKEKGKGKTVKKKPAHPTPPSGALAGRGLELVWVDNAIDAFFLHIQGSGRVRMEDGRILRIGFDGANGQPYKAVGQILIDEKEIPHQEMTMPRLRRWLEEHPLEQRRLFFADRSYVFFHELKGDAVGNINVPLTKDRSIATDHRLFPRGAPGILSTTLPNMDPDGKTVTGWRQNFRFVVNQDTGGAIRGPGRVDLFFGFGELMEYQAGVMKQNGSRLYFIAPRPGVS
ncbi:MAG: MltA domain-containing protein [Magnetococcales bacterium]|nr:MltA domain-containing protein [Magnetococcales bacterium]